MSDALQLLREDHEKVKDMFDQFEKSSGGKKDLGDEILKELYVHAQMEDQIFYRAMAEEGNHEMVNLSEEEHHVVEMLIGELGQMDDSDSHYDAKFQVLRENVEHHIQEEESQMFSKAEKLGKARLQDLGKQMMERKQELMQSFKMPATRRTSSRPSPGGQRKQASRGRRTGARSAS